MDTRTLLDRHPVFACLPAATRERLLSRAERIHLDTGDILDGQSAVPALLVAGHLHSEHGSLSAGDIVQTLHGTAPYALTACTVLRWPTSCEEDLREATEPMVPALRHMPHTLPWRDVRALAYATVLQCIYAALEIAPWLVLEPLVDHCLLYRDASIWPLLCIALGMIAAFGLGASIIHGTLIAPLAVAWATALRRRTISAIYHTVATPHVSPSVERWWNRLRTTLRAVDQLQQHGALWVHEACQVGLSLIVLAGLATQSTFLGLAALLPLACWRMISGRLPVNAAHELFGFQLFRSLHTLFVLALCVQAVRVNGMAMGRLFTVVGLWLNAWDCSMHLLPLRSLPAAVRRRMPMRTTLNPMPPQFHVSLSNVTVTYEGAPTPALENISLDIPPGSALGVVGRCGAGKSTLARLIYGSVIPNSGAVTIDGLTTQVFSHGALRELLAWLGPHTFLPHDDALDNLSLGATALQLERMRWACALCEVDPRDTTGSDAVRARLALARAMMRRPRLLVLDNYLGNFGPDDAQRLLARLRETTPEMTVLVLTSTPHDVHALPYVVTLDQGRIVSRGNPAMLRNTPGLFSYLHAEHAT